ncbi:hypothetical protein MNBD_GAMMA03-525 [hydrothermal vent metagenome]|uniref:Uncharacterized protein n=1 Tax=hydrothermal vent metagenome TaxID=652676 RepID=A0A3B0VYB1_9ZZZZ
MAIDLRKVEPLGSKSVLLEQAMRHQKSSGSSHLGGGHQMRDIDMSDMVTPDFEWLKEDKTAIDGLVRQMDSSIGLLAKQIKEMEMASQRSQMAIEKEQQLLFKQIRTLNSLLKSQIDIFNAIESQMSNTELKQNNLLPQIGIGLMAGLMSAVTILVTAPWLTVLIENMR